MNDALVDTSVWIDYFRHKKSAIGDVFDILLANDRVLTCGIVEMEIFHGLRTNETFQIQAVFGSIRYIDMRREDFIAAGKLWQSLRKKGKTIPSTDCLIAQICIGRNLPLLALDSHFDGIEGLKHLDLHEHG